MNKATGSSRKTPSWDMAVICLVSAWMAFWVIPRIIPSADALGLPPAMLPTVAAIVICGLSGLGFFLSLIGRSQPSPGITRGPCLAVLAVIGLCAMGLIVIRYAGFSAGSIVLIPLLMRLLGERRWHISMIVGLSTAILIHFAMP